MRSGNDLFLLPEFYLWPDARHNDIKRFPLLPVRPRPGSNREILPTPDSSCLWNRIWAALFLPGLRQPGIYKHCRSPVCISIQHSTRLARVLRERKRPSEPRGPAPNPPPKTPPAAPPPSFLLSLFSFPSKPPANAGLAPQPPPNSTQPSLSNLSVS